MKPTVNLAPAELPKESGRFDLPIAIGILVATGQLPGKRLREFEFAGELALTGDLRPIRGALAMTLKAHGDGRAFILPRQSAAEAALVREAVVYPADTLLQVCRHIAGKEPLTPQGRAESSAVALSHSDLSDVKGQPHAKRVMEIAAAGRHSLLILCPSEPSRGQLSLVGFRPQPVANRYVPI